MSDFADQPPHWSGDRVVTEAIDRIHSSLHVGNNLITLDLSKVNDLLDSAETPAYSNMDAMHSVHRDEGMDGFRGAPRVVRALVQLLIERCIVPT